MDMLCYIRSRYGARTLRVGVAVALNGSHGTRNYVSQRSCWFIF